MSFLNRPFLILLLSLILAVPALPDGFPFNPETQQVTVSCLRFRLTPEQTREIAATGLLTFTEENLTLLRPHYPAVLPRARVIAATFNDHRQDLAPTGVYCLWIAPEEIAITLNERHPREKPPFPAPNLTFPTDAELKQLPSRHLRIGPDATLYFRGQPLTLEQACAIIDELTQIPPDPILYLTVAPASPAPLPTGEAESRTPAQIFATLAEYAAAKSIKVQRDW